MSETFKEHLQENPLRTFGRRDIDSQIMKAVHTGNKGRSLTKKRVQAGLAASGLALAALKGVPASIHSQHRVNVNVVNDDKAQVIEVNQPIAEQVIEGMVGSGATEQELSQFVETPLGQSLTVEQHKSK